MVPSVKLTYVVSRSVATMGSTFSVTRFSGERWIIMEFPPSTDSGSIDPGISMSAVAVCVEDEDCMVIPLKLSWDGRMGSSK